MIRSLAGLSLMFFLLSCSVMAQPTLTLLSPTGDGGFETGATFAANGWTVDNYTSNTNNINTWYVGNASGPTHGARAAYISNLGDVDYTYNRYTSARKIFWRDITFPAGYIQVVLTFKIKVQGKANQDDLSVFFQNGNAVPVVTDPGSSGGNAPSIGNATNIETISMQGTDYVTKTYTLNAGNAVTATTRRLIFLWENNNSGATGVRPPASIDEISIVATNPCVPPSLVSFADTFRCGAGEVTMKAAATPGAVVKWYAAANGGTEIGTGNTFTTPVLGANTVTNYYITAKEGNCESWPRQMVTAQVKPAPVATLGSDTTICPGVTYTFDAGNAGADYLWSTGATTQTITADTAGVYSVNVTIDECSIDDTIVVTPGIVPVNIMPDSTDLCDGDTVTLDAGNPGSSFSWMPVAAATQTISVSTGGLYEVNIRSTDGCSIESSSYVKHIPLPVVNLGADTSMCSAATITLDAANPGAAYLWNTSASTRTIDIDTGGIYWVKVTAEGCSDADTLSVITIYGPEVSGINATYSEAATYVFYPLDTMFVGSYLWDFGDGSPAETGYRVQHTYADNGIYTVTCRLQDICSGQYIPISRTVDVFDGRSTTGIKNISNDNTWAVYPNPSEGIIYIEHKSRLKLKNVSLYSLTGRQIKAIYPNDSEATMDVSGAAQGIYLLKASDEKGNLMVRKMEIR